MKVDKTIIGWREWLALPSLGIKRIKAKVDTGARSSALHAFDVEVVDGAVGQRVRFKVHPRQRDIQRTVTAEAPLAGWRHVRNSGGQQTLRPVINCLVQLGGRRFEIELTLIGRDEMGFRMLVGRQALRREFLVDPGRSFAAGRRRRGRKGKNG